MPVKSVTVRVPAKVNLQLSVGPREADGFHNLVTVFQAISIFDDVKVTLAPAKSGVSISIIGDQTHGVPADENNLCTWALRCLVIKEGNRTILIDTGMGDKQDAKFFSHYYPHETVALADALQKINIGIDAITDVLLTHLH